MRRNPEQVDAEVAALITGPGCSATATGTPPPMKRVHYRFEGGPTMKPLRRRWTDNKPSRREELSLAPMTPLAPLTFKRVTAKDGSAAAVLLMSLASIALLAAGVRSNDRKLADFGSSEPYWSGVGIGIGGRTRRLQQAVDPACYGNILRNSAFESGTNHWTADGSNSLSVVPSTYAGGPTGNGDALAVRDRTRTWHGVTQDLAPSLHCFDRDPNTNADYYVRATATVRLEDPDTGAGVEWCIRTQLWDELGWPTKFYCPVLRFFGSTHEFNWIDFHIDVHDTDLVWDPDGWNTLDLIMKVPEDMNGANLDQLKFGVVGGQGGLDLLLDNMVLYRIEESDLPDGHPVFIPRTDHGCETNMFVNGDGEYYSPYGWDAYWSGWTSQNTMDVVAPGHGDDSEYALVVMNRTADTNGLQQFLQAKHCFWDYGYYVRIEADVKLYDQATGAGITTCSSDYSLTMKNCPYLLMHYITNNPRKVESFSYFDYDLMNNYNPDGWNKIDIIIAISPGYTEPTWDIVRFNFVGGPAGSVLELDNAKARKIRYEDIPAGHDIFSLNGQSRNNPIKTCHSVGDPHIMTFGGNEFDNHTAGWNLLYEFGDLRVETNQLQLPRPIPAAINDAVRISYRGKLYLFWAGSLPPTDEYYDHRGFDEVLQFPSNPKGKVFIRWGTMGSKHWYNVWITTEDTGGGGLCCDFNGQLEPPEYGAVIFPESAPTQEEAEEACRSQHLEEGTVVFDDCVFDYRSIGTPPDTTGMNETEAAAALASTRELASMFVQEAMAPVAQVDTMISLIVQSEIYYQLTGEDLSESGVENDPMILGLNNQLFKFEGRSDAWYANLASESVQWNMKFHTFEGCPKGGDTFVTGVAFSFREKRQIEHSVIVRVRNHGSFFAGCVQGQSRGEEGEEEEKEQEVCLGDGSLEIVVDGETIVHPGDYSSWSNNDLRVVAYNTYGECSRKWQDHVEPEVTEEEKEARLLGSNKEKGPRSLASSRKPPLHFVSEKKGRMIDPVSCDKWMRERREYDDLFSQPGGWSTVHIETSQVSFHVEYRQNLDPQEAAARAATGSNGSPGAGAGSGKCVTHSIDAWMSKVSTKFRDQTWSGILGETRDIKRDAEGKRITSDRNALLVGKADSDYEVVGPFGTNFAALQMSPWYWPFRKGV